MLCATLVFGACPDGISEILASEIRLKTIDNVDAGLPTGDDPITLTPLTNSLDYNFLRENDNGYVEYENPGIQFSLKDINGVTDVKCQGKYSTGWAHAAIASVESNILNTTGVSPADLDLSESQLIYFSRNIDGSADAVGNCYLDEMSGADPSEFDDYMSLPNSAEDAAHIMSNWVGVVSEINDPDGIDYTYDNASSSAFSTYNAYKSNAYFLDELYAVDIQNKNKIKNYIKDYGAAYVGMYYDNTYLSGKSVMTGLKSYLTDGPSKKINHAVAIVGWDDDYNQLNFNSRKRPVGKGAWLVKNSFSTEATKDDSGYFYISYEEPLLSSSVYFYTAKKANKNLNNYHYDGGNRIDVKLNTKRFSQIYKTNANLNSVADPTPLNPSNKKNGVEILRQIKLYTCDENVGYSVQLYLHDVTNKANVTDPMNGKPILINKVEGKFENAGYNTIVLPDKLYLEEGKVISYVIDFDKMVGIAADITETENIAVNGNSYSLKNVDDSNAGESYFDNNGALIPLNENYTPWAKLITEDADEIPEGDEIPDNILLLDETDVEVRIGDTYEITYSIAPDNDPSPAITYTSADPLIATVDADGVIEGISAGSTVITAKYQNKKYDINVSVVKPIDELVIIAFDKYGNIVNPTIPETGEMEYYELGVFSQYTFKVYAKDEYDALGVLATPIDDAYIQSDTAYLFSIDTDNMGEFTKEMQDIVMSKCAPEETYNSKRITVSAIVPKEIAHTDEDVSCDIQIRANNDVKTHNVVFYRNADKKAETYASVKVAENRKVASPTPPVWDGRIFLGWDTSYDPDDLGDRYKLVSKYDFNEKVTAPLDLYAKWSRRDDFRIKASSEYLIVEKEEELDISALLQYVDGSKTADAIIKFTIDDPSIASMNVSQEYSTVTSDIKATIKGLERGKTIITARVYYSDPAVDADGNLVYDDEGNQVFVYTPVDVITEIQVNVTDEKTITVGDDNLPPADRTITIGTFERAQAFTADNPTFNLYYVEPKVDLNFKTKSKYAVEKIELSDELKTKFAVVKEEDKYYFVKNPSYPDSLKRSDSGIQGELLVYFDHFEKPSKKKITVRMDYKEPKILQKGTPIFDPLSPEAVTYDLYCSGILVDMSDASLVNEIGASVSSLDIDGFKVSVTNGELRLSVTDPKIAATKHQLKLKISKPEWTEPVKIVLSAQVKRGTPRVTFSPTTVTLNGIKKCHPNYAGIKLTIDKKNIHFLSSDEWVVSVYNAKLRKYEKSDRFLLEYKDGMLYISLKEYNDQENYFGTYKVRIENFISGYQMVKDLNIKIVDEVPVATVKLTGSYDLTNSKSRDLKGNVTLRYIQGNIVDVDLNSDEYYATVVSEKTFSINKYSSVVAKENTNVNTKTGCEVFATITLDNGLKLENVKFRIKPKQTIPSVRLGAFNLKKSDPVDARKAKIDVQSFVPDGIVVTKVRNLTADSVMSSFDCEISDDGDRAGIILTLKGDAQKIGRQNLKFELYVAGAETSDTYPDGRPTVFAVPINIQE